MVSYVSEVLDFMSSFMLHGLLQNFHLPSMVTEGDGKTMYPTYNIFLENRLFWFFEM